jgi:polyisoprenoid-binding protein YceI
MSWEIDPVHSNATFAVRHAMVATVRGQFKVLSGTLEIDEEHPENSSIAAQAETASIDTRDANRDAHLRSADFFESEKYPIISFKSTHVEKTGDGTYRVTGILDMHGIQKEITLDAEYAGQGKDPYGNTRAGISATGRINRKDFGLNWNAVLEAGGVLVSDAVKIEIDLSAINKG